MLKRPLSDEQLKTLVSEFYTESDEDIVGLFSIAQAVENLISDADAAREQAHRLPRSQFLPLENLSRQQAL